MIELSGMPSLQAHLYQLTLQLKDKKWNVYSMGNSVDDAYSRYLDRAARRYESSPGLVLVGGELAAPNIPSQK